MTQAQPSVGRQSDVLRRTSFLLRKRRRTAYIPQEDMMSEYYTLRDASRILAVPPYKITYLLAIGACPEPARIGGRRCFTITDLAKLAELLNVQLTRELHLKDQLAR
jgi:hypothetical protein